MGRIALLKNVIQCYDWGSTTAIPELLGKAPDGNPQAELWMGAHPNAPSSVDVNGNWVPLTQLVAESPEAIIGKSAAIRFNQKLPFLFKILAAEKPLSIQAHPDVLHAREGFRAETSAGIPPDAPNRSYRDSNHKPECICALTPFWALNGFRKIQEILAYFDQICPNTLAEELASLEENQNSMGLKRFFQSLMTKPKHEVLSIVNEAVQGAVHLKDDDPVFCWIVRLVEAYPQDIGVLAPAMLNLVCLEPGEAMYLSAGRLHAYLEGVGMELMANSDNVLRGGLTPKKKDVPGLMKVLHFGETVLEILKPVPDGPGVRSYQTPAEEFLLSEIFVSDTLPFNSRPNRSVEILFCLQGNAMVSEASSSKPMNVTKGMSLIVPAAVNRYRIEGEARFYRASVGHAYISSSTKIRPEW